MSKDARARFKNNHWIQSIHSTTFIHNCLKKVINERTPPMNYKQKMENKREG